MNRGKMTVVAALAAWALQAVPGHAATAATVGGATSVPYGWVDFCNRYGGECDAPALPPENVVLTPKVMKVLDRINRSVNKTVQPVTDNEHWGVVDRWDYPTDGKGDCEDFALLKRKMLQDAGLPRQALLMTVVKDQAGEGHAILTVVTSKGDYVLDNMVDTLKPWDQTGYKFVKRQSQEDPNVWRTITPTVPAPLYTANQ
jgi:predicted transglutaminase-like cysteine proteinase